MAKLLKLKIRLIALNQALVLWSPIDFMLCTADFVATACTSGYSTRHTNLQSLSLLLYTHSWRNIRPTWRQLLPRELLNWLQRNRRLKTSCAVSGQLKYSANKLKRDITTGFH